MRLAIFVDRQFTSGELVLELSDQMLRSPNAFIHLTSSEEKVMSALIEKSKTGVQLVDIPSLLSHSVSDRSIHIVRTHIYKLKTKLSVISQGRVAILFNSPSQRYFLVET